MDSYPRNRTFEKVTAARRSGGVLLFVIFCFWFSLYTYPSILTPYLEDLGSSLSFSGVVVGSYGFTQMLLRLPAGILSDRLRNRRIFVSAGLVFSALSALGFFLTRSLWMILIFRGLAGVAAAMWVQMSTLYASYFPADQNWRAIGRINFANNIGQMIAMLSGGLLAGTYGWSSPFLLSLIVASAGLAASLLVHEDRADETVPAPGIRESFLIGREPLLLGASLFALLAQLVTFATSQGFVPVYARQLGAATQIIGLMAALAAIPRALASLLGARLVGRFTASQLIVSGFLLNGLMLLSLPFINSVPLLIANQMITGIGNGLQMTLLMALCTRNIAPGRKSSAMGFYQAIYGIGMVSGPVLVGLLSDRFNLESSFLVIGAVSLISGLAAWQLLPRLRTTQRQV